MNTTKTVRVRIAPSPTGEDIHIGNLYTALLNWAYATRNNGAFIIRIEDTDRERFVKGAEEKILASVKSFGLMYAEGPDIGGPFAPYRQSERLPLYKKHAEELLQKGHAYYCFCTRERLEELRTSQTLDKKVPRYDKHCLNTVQDARERIEKGEKYVVRLNVVSGKTVAFQDLIRGEIKFESDLIDDQVLLKSDGYPTYHLGVVVDDNIMEISHVVRAEEWISSTPKHILLYEAFGWELPVFCHLPILRNPDKSKLSKRKNPVWAAWYLQEGFLPEAVLNFLALLGWSHPQEKEIFTLSEFVSHFDLKDVKAVAPIFDITKLTWMNQQYIQNLEVNDLRIRLEKFYGDDADVLEVLKNNETVAILELAKTRMKTLKEFKDLVILMHTVLSTDQEKAVAKDLHETFTALVSWEKESIFEACRSVMTKHTVRMPLLYTIFTGKERGLPLPEMLVIRGKEEVLSRLQSLL